MGEPTEEVPVPSPTNKSIEQSHRAARRTEEFPGEGCSRAPRPEMFGALLPKATKGAGEVRARVKRERG